MSNPEHLNVEQVDNVTVVSFGSDPVSLNESMLSDLVAPLLEVTGEPTTNLLVDLSSVEFFSSSFIEVLFRLWNRTKANGQQFALCGLHPYCREVLEVTNLTSVWKIYEDRDDALAALDSDMAAWSTH